MQPWMICCTRAAGMLSGELFCSDCVEPPSGAGSPSPQGRLGVTSAALMGALQGPRPASASERCKREVTEAVTWEETCSR